MAALFVSGAVCGALDPRLREDDEGKEIVAIPAQAGIQSGQSPRL